MIGEIDNMAEILIGVEITAKEADCFRKMREAGVFEIVDGNCTLNFDKRGVLAKIEKKIYTAFPVAHETVA